MAAKNDITGDEIRSKPNSDAYRNSPFWDKKAKPCKQCKMEGGFHKLDCSEGVKQYLDARQKNGDFG